MSNAAFEIFKMLNEGHKEPKKVILTTHNPYQEEYRDKILSEVAKELEKDKNKKEGGKVMFIKWQGKNLWTNLNQIDSIYIRDCYGIDDEEERLPPTKWAVMAFIGEHDANIGWYDTEERAEEVINEILCQNCKVYEMPEE